MKSAKKMKEIVLIVLFAFGLRSVVAESAAEETSDVAMAATLIGCISFIMVLYYFTNWPDEDIQASTWDTISSTISIFCAVLLFQSFNACVEEVIINPLFGEEEATFGALMCDMIHMMIWFAILQYLLAKLSGANDDESLSAQFTPSPNATPKEKRHINRLKRKDQETRELNLTCFGVLMAHLTGFASINAWGTVQQFSFFKQSPLHALLAVPIALVGQLILQRITDYWRESRSLGDDGEKSWYEDKWDEGAEEAENDVMGLTLSFLTMNAIRMSITGCLPNQEGKEEECKVEEYLYHHPLGQRMWMLVIVVLTTCAIFAVFFYFPTREEKEEEEEEDTEGEEEEEAEEPPTAVASKEEVFQRLHECLAVALSMLFSWAFFYSIQMMLASLKEFEGQEELLMVCLAMTISLVSFGLLVLFDRAADADSGHILKAVGIGKDLTPEQFKAKAEEFDEKVDRALRQIMFAIGLAIGFAWEQCFDKSVDSIAETMEDSKVPLVNPVTTKIYLSVFCSILLVPAWRLYVLPFMRQKGWKYGWGVNLAEKYDNASPELKHQLHQHSLALKKLVKQTKELAEGEEASQGNAFASVDSLAAPLIKNESAASKSAGTAASSASEATLEKENKELKTQLNAYKKMFDDHMNTMGNNLRAMHGALDKLNA